MGVMSCFLIHGIVIGICLLDMRFHLGALSTASFANALGAETLFYFQGINSNVLLCDNNSVSLNETYSKHVVPGDAFKSMLWNAGDERKAM